MTKYLYAVLHAFNAEGIATPLFIGALSAVYGLLSGYFSSRAVKLIKLAQVAHPQAAGSSGSHGIR